MMADEADLFYLLAPPGAVKQIGPETGRPKRDGIARFNVGKISPSERELAKRLAAGG